MRTIQEWCGEDNRSEKRTKKYLKTLIQSELEDIEFQKHVQRNKSEKIYSKFVNDKILEAAVAKTLENKGNNIKVISKAAKIIRAACLQHIRTSENTYDCHGIPNECDVPHELACRTLVGYRDLCGRRNNGMDHVANSLCNNILFNIKTDRQVAYNPKP